MTTMAGGRTPSATTTSAAVATVARVTRSRAVEPCSIIATGRSAATPAASAAAQMPGRADTAIR